MEGEDEKQKQKQKQYTVQKFQELPSVSFWDLSEIRYFDHTQLENRDRRKILLLVLRNHLEELKERKAIIHNNYDQIKQYEDDLKVRKQRDAKELNKLHRIVDEMREAMAVTVESTSKYTFRATTTTRRQPHEKEERLLRSEQDEGHSEINTEKISDIEDSYDNDEEDGSEEGKDKKSVSKSKNKSKTKSKNKKKSSSKISDRSSSKRLRTKIMSPQHSSLPTTNLSPSNPIYGGTVMTSSSSITTSNANIPTQTQTLAEQCGFTVEDVRSKTVKLFPQTTVSPVSNDYLHQLWNQTQEYFSPLSNELVNVILGLDPVSSIPTYSTKTVEVLQQEEKPVSWIDRLLGCLIIDSPSTSTYLSISNYPFDEAMINLLAKDVLKKIRRRNQENESKSLHRYPKKGLCEDNSARLEGDLTADNQDEDQDMLNRAIEDELRDIGLVMEEALPADGWTDENDFLEDENDGNTLAMKIQELKSTRQNIQEIMNKIKPRFLEEVEYLSKRRRHI